MEKTVLPCPEIVNPYNLANRRSSDRDFVVDIELDRFIHSIPFSFDQKPLVTSIMVDMVSDAETVKYRQDALEVLINTPELRNKFKKVVSDLGKMRNRLWNLMNTFNLSKGLELLREYRDFMRNFPDIGTAQSEAISTVCDYCKKVRDSDEFSEMCKFIDRMEKLVGVDFRVFLDSRGNPVNMSAMELVEKEEKPRKAIFEKLLGKKLPHENKSNLTAFDGLNEVGKVIKAYMDRRFANIVMGYVPQMEEVIKLCGSIDFYAAFAEYFAGLQKMGVEISRPTLLPREERRMKVDNAVNPLLMEAGNNGHKIVPNDIRYNGDKNFFIITGPNNGGKTTYIKTIGLIQLMAQSGLFVTAKSAEVSFIDGIYTHFVAPDDITMGEGRYKNELLRMKEIFEGATPYSLVILDEPCGGTSYEEGQRQSLVLLDGFYKLGATTYFTTHMHPLTKEIENGRYPAGSNYQLECLDDGKELKFTYRYIRGSSGKSFGEEIAREIGLRPENIFETVSKNAEEKGYKALLR